MGKRRRAMARRHRWAVTGKRRWAAVVGAMCILAPAGVALTGIPAAAATHPDTAAHRAHAVRHAAATDHTGGARQTGGTAPAGGTGRSRGTATGNGTETRGRAARTGGARTGGARTGGARTGGARTGGAKTGGAKTGGANSGGAKTGGATPRGVGITTRIVLARGGYKYCLDDFGRGTRTGTRVVLWRCDRSDPAQRWVFHAGGVIEPKVAPGMALGVNRSGRTVLESASTATAAWSYRANGLLAHAAATAAPQAAEPMLNDPRYRVGDGVQLIVYRQARRTSNAHWWIQGARYATTKLVNLPDAGLHGGFWALDNGTFKQALIYTGTDANGAATYQDAQQQDAAFTTMPGDPQPNATTGTAKIGDVLTGGMYGWYTSTLTSNRPVSTVPPKSAGGLKAWVSLGPAQFFGSKATVTSGKASGYFAYTSAKDNCGNVEKMVQTDDAGTFSGSGNIPAYAADSAQNLAGGQVCPAPGA